MSEPKYKLGDFVKVEGCLHKGVISKVTTSYDPDWPHKYKVQGEFGALTFDEGSIIPINEHGF